MWHATDKLNSKLTKKKNKEILYILLLFFFSLWLSFVWLSYLLFRFAHVFDGRRVAFTFCFCFLCHPLAHHHPPSLPPMWRIQPEIGAHLLRVNLFLPKPPTENKKKKTQTWSTFAAHSPSPFFRGFPVQGSLSNRYYLTFCLIFNWAELING